MYLGKSLFNIEFQTIIGWSFILIESQFLWLDLYYISFLFII